MRKRTGLVASGAMLAATIGLFGTAASASASTTSASTASPVVGYTYLDGNTATSNTIDAFARHADGSVSPVGSGTFAAGGAGSGAGLGSQGAVQVTQDHRFLLAVDAGSNQISVLRITAGGVPVPVGQPVSSGGNDPVSVAVSPGGLVYVANAGATDSNYTGFRLGFNGSLTPIPGSTFAVPNGSGLGDVFFNALGTQLVGTRTTTSEIDSFDVLPGGHLLPAPGSPFTGQGLGQLGAEFSPTHLNHLYISDAHNGAGLGDISAYNDNFLGQLSSIGNSPFADNQTAPCWVEISHDGRFLFTVNTGSDNISSYAINRDGSLTLLGSTPITGGGADIDARLTPNGQQLLVDGSGNHILSVFDVNGGQLTEVPSSPTPLPAGGAPSGIVNI
jgi:6-phosphogluconolactonase (cycloisomerase 2 family)